MNSEQSNKPELQRTPDTWQFSKPQDSVVEDFVKQYRREVSHLKDLCEHVALQIEHALEAEKAKSKGQALQAKVTWRTKNPDSLREKLQMKNQGRQEKKLEKYKSSQEIRDNIWDLAGVRIVLYVPSKSEREKIKAIIYRLFKPDIQEKFKEGKGKKVNDDKKKEEKKEKPAPEELETPQKYRRIHMGYKAVHYLIRLNKEHELGSHRYTFEDGDKVEIQVVSALSHAWAEAEHDVGYKSFAYGKPPLEEERILDALNGLIQSGDLLLEQFHELVEKRTFRPFKHFHDLGHYLSTLEVLPEEHRNLEGPPLEMLFEYLRIQEQNYPVAILDAVRKMGTPIELQLNRFSPRFQPHNSMIVLFCLIAYMIPSFDPKADTTSEVGKQCLIMMETLILLQKLAGSAQPARRILLARVRKRSDVRKSISFVLTDPGRQYILDDTDKFIAKSQRKVEPVVRSAWNWFRKEAENPKSVCGLVFRLAEMGVYKGKGWEHSMAELSQFESLSSSESDSG